MVYNFTIQDFTVTQLLRYLENTGIPRTAKLYNSCSHDTHTVELLKRGEIINFEPICGLYEEDYTVTAVYDFEGKQPTLTVEDLYTITNKYLCIERDIEYGYVYSNYDTIVCNKEHVVLL